VRIYDPSADLHEIREPMRHPLLAAALEEGDPVAALDCAEEDRLINPLRHKNVRELSRAA
jgi:homoserine kinase